MLNADAVARSYCRESDWVAVLGRIDWWLSRKAVKRAPDRSPLLSEGGTGFDLVPPLSMAAADGLWRARELRSQPLFAADKDMEWPSGLGLQYQAVLWVAT